MEMNAKQFDYVLPNPPISPYSTEVGREIRAKAAALVPLLRKHAQEGEELGALAPESLKALSDIGAFKLTLPTDFGGHALGARDVVEIVTEFGRGDGAAGWMAFVAGGLRNILAFPDQAVNEIFADGRDWVGPLAAGASILPPRLARRGGSRAAGWSAAPGISAAVANMPNGLPLALIMRLRRVTWAAPWRF